MNSGVNSVTLSKGTYDGSLDVYSSEYHHSNGMIGDSQLNKISWDETIWPTPYGTSMIRKNVEHWPLQWLFETEAHMIITHGGKKVKHYMNFNDYYGYCTSFCSKDVLDAFNGYKDSFCVTPDSSMTIEVNAVLNVMPVAGQCLDENFLANNPDGMVNGKKVFMKFDNTVKVEECFYRDINDEDVANSNFSKFITMDAYHSTALFQETVYTSKMSNNEIDNAIKSVVDLWSDQDYLDSLNPVQIGFIYDTGAHEY